MFVTLRICIIDISWT